MLRIFDRTILLALLPLCVFSFDVYQDEANRLAGLMNWKPGQVIAEIGAGEGEIAFSSAARVGSTGHVYATELDPNKYAHLKEEVRERGLENVTVIKADPIDTDLPQNCCDDILMRRVYHHFLHPDQTDASIFRALKPGGLLAIIDFPPRRGLPPVEGAPKSHGGHGIPKNVLIEELRSVGFEIRAEQDGWPEHDYCVIARKPVPP